MKKNFGRGLIIILLLNSCVPPTMHLEVPDGPPAYQAGWHDGCSNAIATSGFVPGKFYKSGFGKGIYQHDPIYQNAYAAAFFACVTQASDYQGHPGMETAPFQ